MWRFIIAMTFKTAIFPLFSKGGQGGLNNRLIIPLNPPLGKGDFKTDVQFGLHKCHTIVEARPSGQRPWSLP
jgi:hypothetical protein